MQASDIPLKIQVPFATNGDKIVIPVPSQIGIADGRASWTTGFVPLNAAPLSAGGVAPFETDFNGIFNQITAIQQWQCAGGYFKYDATFSTAIGGYPKYAQLVGATGIVYVNQVDNNISNPESGGTGWSILVGSYSDFMAFTINTTLTAVHSGRLLAIGTPGITLQLPAANSVKSGTSISFIALKSGTITSANNIVWFDAVTTSINLVAGEICEFTSNNTEWYVSGGTLAVRPIGSHQTWQNVTASRAVNTTYTNTSGRPIMVVAGVTSNSAQSTATVVIDGVTLGGSSAYVAGAPQSSISVIIPAGSTYLVSVSVGTPTLQTWSELR